MNRKHGATLAVAAMLAVALYLVPIPQRGLVGPDEPRYASIARHMAESGNWVTPVLWGEPWFEKPTMLFWLGAAGYAVGFDAYARIPVALLSLGFLAFFFRTVQKAFGVRTAVPATCVLGTSAGWVAYSDAGVFDAPLTAFTSAALLSLLPWVQEPGDGNRRCLVPFGALLGLGVLSKGLVAPVVALFALMPVVLARPSSALDLLSHRSLIPFAAVCLPWYVACYWLNGAVFVEEFIVRHHLQRFVSSSLEHVQPWWFFGPVLLVFLLPWTPLLLGLGREALWSEPRLRFLTAWALGTIAFFSLSVNKLPAYILPSIPPLAVLLAIQWQRAPQRRLLLAAACSLLLVPLAGALIAPALADGISRAWDGLQPRSLAAGLVAGIAVASLAALAALKPGRSWAIPAVGAVAALALALLKLQTFPSASRLAGTREFYLENQSRMEQACLGEVRRHVAYGFRHYGRDMIPECGSKPRFFRIEGHPPRIVRNDPETQGKPALP